MKDKEAAESAADPELGDGEIGGRTVHLEIISYRDYVNINGPPVKQ